MQPKTDQSVVLCSHLIVSEQLRCEQDAVQLHPKQVLVQEMEINMSEEKVRTEEFSVNGEDLIGKIKEILHESNIRRIIIKKKDGSTVMEIPMTLGVVGALIAPQLAAIGAIAALVTEATVVVEKVE